MDNVIKRNGTVVAFDASKIETALQKAFVAQLGNHPSIDSRIQEVMACILPAVHALPAPASIEAIQDVVEYALISKGEHHVGRAYILYRASRAQVRAQENGSVRLSDGATLSKTDMVDEAVRVCHELEYVDPIELVDRAFQELYDGVSLKEVQQALILAARSKIEKAPEYSFVAARFEMTDLYVEVFQEDRSAIQAGLGAVHRKRFVDNLHLGVAYGLLDERLLTTFDLETLAAALDPERDQLYDYLGIKTLADRYFLHVMGRRIETPQLLLMRVAMGVSLDEDHPTEQAIEFYNLISQHDYFPSTPTLFNAGCAHPQLSSCYLTTVPDDLAGIFNTYRDNALLSKFAGGIGNDWTPVRGTGALIRGTNGKSQGVVPFLKVDNDTAIAVNQGGKRKGAICAYLESWHIDVFEFLELRKNTGDERRRTHDMNTANWIPDLLMMRAIRDEQWTLFSPEEVPELHDLYGLDFVRHYENYERLAQAGQMKVFRVVSAKELWRKMLSMLFETGHPWLTFKDPMNLRSPQKHAGVVHSSNLCTEISLNTKVSTYNAYGERTSVGEIAVCNLGSINLVNHLVRDALGQVRLDIPKLKRTVALAVRMLDNVISLNYYPVPEALTANLTHRPVGLGIMGFQDMLYLRGVPYGSPEAARVAAEVQEAVAVFAYSASADLAQERGSYTSFEGSDWSKGILPPDTVEYVAQARPGFSDELVTLAEVGLHVFTPDEIEELRAKVKKGMRNSNVLAIAPTATISNIVGVTQSIEPAYQNLYVKGNLSGDFTVINRYLVAELRQLGLWTQGMIDALKAREGSLQDLDVPQHLKDLFATAFEIEAEFLIDAAVRRQLWIDQAQSLNLYVAKPSGKRLDGMFKYAWKRGLKTSYYLRSLSASSAERSTGTGGELNAVAKGPSAPAIQEGAVCTPYLKDDGSMGCDVCQ